VWVGTDDGLYRWLPGGAALQRMTLAGGQPLGGPVFALALAVGGGLWVGTARGLYRVAPGSAEMRAVVAAPDRGLGNAVVIGLLLDRQHRLWVDTAVTGLHRLQRWDGQQAEFDRVSQRHGILSRPFGANLMEDRRGRIWTHMAVYDPTSDQLDELSAADGVNFGTGWFHVHAQTADGRLLFGGSRGLLEVDPEGFVASAYAPPVVITELRVNGEPQPLPSAQRLRIEPGQRSFSIEFAALDYADPGRNRYAYQLQGFDPDWIPTGAELRVASYSNLDPGRYRLRVRGSNRSGLWSPQELDLELQVLPAWWQHWGFRLALLALLSGLAYALLQLRTQQMRQRQGVLEGRVRDRTAELEAITQALRQESTALAEASLTDPLTGLRNRRFLAMHIGQDVALALRRHDHRNQQGAPSPDDADLIFFLVDIDLFKQANDRHGHAAGDSVLVQMRSRLLEVFRDSDHLVRWGGEEFLVVARDSTRRHAAALAERARAAVADRPFVLPDGTLLTRTCSIGFCCFPLAPALGGVLDWSAAVLSADAALYAVKSAGRNGWLGLLAARAESPEALCQRARGPLADWARSGELTVAHSAAHGHWADALTAGS
jgi:diguanylate cyclase (GGDEF)-like protein